MSHTEPCSCVAELRSQGFGSGYGRGVAVGDRFRSGPSR